MLLSDSVFQLQKGMELATTRSGLGAGNKKPQSLSQQGVNGNLWPKKDNLSKTFIVLSI